MESKMVLFLTVYMGYIYLFHYNIFDMYKV